MVLPKSMRLKGYKCFDYLYKKGIRHNGHSMLLRVAKAEPRLHKSLNKEPAKSSLRFAIAISNKVSKKAVIRNRMRRLLHEHLKLRLINKQANQENWALLSLKPQASEKETISLIKECDILLRKAGLLR